MLQIRLSTVPPSEGGGGGGGGGGAKPSQMESVTVACPDHLVLADLPVAKSLGSVTAAASIVVKTLGRRSRRQLGERVHFCVRCDYPIAIYGRLSPCEHAFCLDCARSDSLCYLCDERIQKIQTIKLMEGIFVCAAPHCLKSFLKMNEFESHIHNIHSDLLGRNKNKDSTDTEAVSARKPAASDSTVQAPLRPVLSPSSNSQIHDREDKRTQPRDQQPTRLVIQPKSNPALYGQSQSQNNGDQQQPRPQGFDGPSPRFPQQGFDAQSPNFAVPVNSNFAMAPGPFGYPPFGPNGPQPFYGAPFEMMRPDSLPEGGSEQGSLLGFPPIYPQGPWNMAPGGGMHMGSAPMVMQTDSQGGVGMFQGDYGRNQGGVLPSPNSSGNVMDSKGILAPPPQPFQPPPPHLGNVKRGNFYPADMAHDGQQQGFGWPHEKHDSFGNGQD